jgi:anti-sigma B factor antagonist
MKDLLRVRRGESDGMAVLALSGELDLASAPVLERELTAVDGVSQALIVDLTDCGFVDSTGLAVLVRAVEADGRTVALVNPAPPVRRLFDVTAIEKLIPIFDTVADARTAFPLPGARVQGQTPDQ